MSTVMPPLLSKMDADLQVNKTLPPNKILAFASLLPATLYGGCGIEECGYKIARDGTLSQRAHFFHLYLRWHAILLVYYSIHEDVPIFFENFPDFRSSQCNTLSFF